MTRKHFAFCAKSYSGFVGEREAEEREYEVMEQWRGMNRLV